MPITINLNDTVYFELTDFGRRVARENGAKESVIGWATSLQLWELLAVLGCKSQYNGSPALLVDNVFEWRGGARDADVRPIESTLRSDLVACLNALRRTSSDPVACALAQRHVAELTIEQAASSPSWSRRLAAWRR